MRTSKKDNQIGISQDLEAKKAARNLGEHDMAGRCANARRE